MTQPLMPGKRIWRADPELPVAVEVDSEPVTVQDNRVLEMYGHRFTLTLERYRWNTAQDGWWLTVVEPPADDRDDGGQEDGVEPVPVLRCRVADVDAGPTRAADAERVRSVLDARRRSWEGTRSHSRCGSGGVR
jgi:hypothetical protein